MNEKCHMSNFKRQMSSANCQVPNAKWQMWNDKWQMWNDKCEMLNVKCWMSKKDDKKCGTSDRREASGASSGEGEVAAWKDQNLSVVKNFE